MKCGKFQSARKRAPAWYMTLLITLSLIFCVSAWRVVHYCLSSREQSQAFQELAELVDAVRPPVLSHAESVSQIPGETACEASDASISSAEPAIYENLRTDTGILLEYAGLYERNNDMAGWLSIPGTSIHYPVMHTPGRPDYYLKRNFDGKSSSWGSLYAREECSLTDPSDNITIYGHNMKDGSMFAGLLDYTSREFWENHRYLHFDTLYEHHVYEIFAVFTTTASQDKGFAYHDFIHAPEQESFDAFVNQCLALSLYDTDLVPRYGDKLICLSTCEYTQANGRMVVAAVRIH